MNKMDERMVIRGYVAYSIYCFFEDILKRIFSFSTPTVIRRSLKIFK